MVELRSAVSQFNPKQSRWRSLALAAIVIGVVLRIWQYVANPSIWVDEAAIARNILDRSPWQLLGSLDYAQVAPPGFLLGVKLSVTLFGSSEYALRLVPFIAGIASPVLFFMVARFVLRPIGAIVAVLMFSLAIPQIILSSNLKQYSSDVAATLLVVGIALRLRRSPIKRPKAYGFALVSVPLLFCSYAAVFALTAAGVAIFADAFVTGRPDRWYRLGVVAGWAIAIAATIAYGLSVMTTVDNVYLHRFWEGAFMPREGAVDWLWRTARYTLATSPDPWEFDGSLHYPWPKLFAVLLVIGTLVMCVYTPANGAIIAGPVVLAVVAASVRAYPLNPRLCLFLLPLILLLVVAGVQYIGQRLIPWWQGEYTPVWLLPVAIATFLWQLPPHTVDQVRPLIEYVSTNRKPGDALWVYYGAGQAFLYYTRRWPIEGNVRIGNCDRVDPRNYLRQVDAERGRPRVWVLMAHGSGPFLFDERKLLTDYLDTIGKRIDEFHSPGEDRAEVFLYDLSNIEKLASSSADSFEVPNTNHPMSWSCYGTMSPLGPTESVIASVMREGTR